MQLARHQVSYVHVPHPNLCLIFYLYYETHSNSFFVIGEEIERISNLI